MNLNKIFLCEKEINYNTPDKYAFLNWRFDNGTGYNDKQNPKQPIFDNFEMGKAHLANAVLTIYSLVYSSNYCSVADSLIFPVLFNVWHSIELLLKCGTQALTILVNNQNTTPLSHDIFKLKGVFEAALKNANMNLTVTNNLVHLNYLISEFKKVNAHFDFARYSFDSKGDFQFYNAPYNDSKQWQSCTFKDIGNVPNTCVDISSLLEVLVNTSTTFLTLIYYLNVCISEAEQPTDKGFDSFKKTKGHFNNDDELNEEDPIRKILSAIFLEIL